MTTTIIETPSAPPPPWKRRLYLPAYMMVDAARYTGTNTQTIAYWYYGGEGLGPVLPGKEPRRPLSYLQLIEVAFVATFRQLKLSLQKIRKARQYAAQNLSSEYPFAELAWKTEGVHLLLDLKQVEGDAELGRLILGDEHGQLAWQPMVAERFAQFDYEAGMALVWHLIGQESPISINPRVAFGAPTVKGIPTWVIKGRWVAGEPVEDIKEDFRLEPEYIKEALRFEGIEIA